jgi:type II secretory pathway component PulM
MDTESIMQLATDINNVAAATAKPLHERIHKLEAEIAKLKFALQTIAKTKGSTVNNLRAVAGQALKGESDGSAKD